MKPREQQRKKVFIVSGTHAGETLFAKHVADRLQKKLSKQHEVVRVELPASRAERHLPVGDGLSGSLDFSAVSVTKLLKERGFDVHDKNHVVLDVQETPLNWREVYPKEFYPKRAGFYEKNVEPAIRKSLADKHYGIYFAEVTDPHLFVDVNLLPRKEIKLLGESEANFFRIEVPVVGVKDKKSVVAHEKRTLALLRPKLALAFSRKAYGRKAGNLIHKLLGL